MLSEKQLNGIREHLERAQNPIFFFDNDADGLCSFLLLRRYIGRGKGVAIKSFPDLNESYARKITELNADYIFILDKPKVDEGFIEVVKQLNIPCVWIDHHDLTEEEQKIPKEFYYYNPTKPEKEHEKTSEPVTYWAYKITNKKQDVWIAVVGCLGDGFMPEFIKEFKEKYPGYWVENVVTAFEAIYNTEMGRLVQILSFALKDKTSNVVRMLKFLIESKSPADILKENKKNYRILRRYHYVNTKYKKLIDKAKEIESKNHFSSVLFFQYGGDLSLSADIANELYFLYPEKIIVVVYIKGAKANTSLRGKINVRKLTINAVKNIEGATGGGHRHATGAQIPVEELSRFKENIIRILK